MKVLLASTHDYKGGAARAAHRLYAALGARGVEAHMLAYSRSQPDPAVHTPFDMAGAVWDTLQMRYTRWQNTRAVRNIRHEKSDVWNINHTMNPFVEYIGALSPDILHLHWVAEGFMPIRALQDVKMPIVWTMHDQWAFSGGCHYTRGCTRYETGCGSCPQLCRSHAHDLSAKMHGERLNAWRDIPMSIIAPSQWMAECARRSAVLRDKMIVVIPNTLPVNIYQPLDKTAARQAFGLPQDKQLILFGATHSTSAPRKGYAEMRASVAHLAQQPRARDLALVVIGAHTILATDWALPVYNLGVLRDDVSLALAYSACDVFAAPSQQDNLPNTVLEAMACGVPSVAFDIGGMPDLILHEHTGMIVPAFDTHAFAEALLQTLDQGNTWGVAARERALAHFSPDVIAAQHLALYQSMKATL